MARKETITKEILISTAFELTKEEGFPNVTARKLAAKAGCSTQPIFRLYRNMEELGEELYSIAISFFHKFYEEFPKNQELPFVNLGLAYIQFAAEEKHLFQLLFLSENRNGRSLYELLNGEQNEVLHEIVKAKDGGCHNSSELFMQMWIFIHGAACMNMTGDYDLELNQTIDLLNQTYCSFSAEH